MHKASLSAKILIGLLIGGGLGLAAKTLAHDAAWLCTWRAGDGTTTRFH